MSDDMLTKIHNEMVKTRYIMASGFIISLVLMLLMWGSVIENRSAIENHNEVKNYNKTTECSRCHN